MAVPEQTPYKEYAANGSTTSFALTFKCKDKAHLIVKLDDLDASVDTWKLDNGTVVFNTAPANGTKIFLQRKTPNRRTTDYKSFNNSFSPSALNEDLDTLWLRLQEEEVSKFLLNQLINMNYEELDKKGQDIRSELINRLTEKTNQLNDQILQQGLSQQQLQNYYLFLLGQMANLSNGKNWLASLIADASGRNQQEINDVVADVRKFGAVGDNVLHKVREWTQIGSRIYFPSLTAIKASYPHVTSLDDSCDWAAVQQAVNTPNLYKIKFPCVVANGIYDFGSNELIIPNNKSNLTFIGDGSADAGATVIRSTPNKNGFIAINSKAYATTLQDLALLSTTGNDDGFAAIGFQHMRETTGSTGRLCHLNFRIMGFSKHACKVGQAINYQFDNITFTGGIETLWIGRDAILDQRSTTVSMYHAYITGGKRCGVYLDHPSDFMADRLIIESCGKGIDPSTGTFYVDAAGLIAVGVGQAQLNAPYFEDNRRNIHSQGSIVIISANYGPATLPDVWDFSNPGFLDNQKGRIELLRNGIRTRYLLADEYKGYIEVPDEIRFNSSAKFNTELIAKDLFVGSSAKYGRVDGEQNIYINSNMPGTTNLNVRGQFLNFGVTNSSVGVASQWMQLGHRRTASSSASALDVLVNTGTTSFKPDGTPYTLLTFDSTKKVHPGVDNEVSFGTASNRWKDVYASTGTIQTSDERLKQQFRTQTEAEKAAALEIKDSICFFKFNEAVEIKDDGARWHCGVKAQQVVTILKNHGLDPFSYAFVCYDEWEEVQASILTEYTYLASKIDENGWEYLEPVTEMVETGEVETLREAGNRYSIRYDELMMFILRAIL